MNPEKDWGSDTLAAGRYAMYVLNERYGTDANRAVHHRQHHRDCGLRIQRRCGLTARGRAGHQRPDRRRGGLRTVTEMPTASGYGIQFGGAAVAGYGKTLADFTTFGNIYQPQAALAPGAALTETSIFNYIGLVGMTARATARCDSLAAKGWSAVPTPPPVRKTPLNKLRAFGWTPETDQMHNAHYALGNGPILSAMYPVSYGRFAVDANVLQHQLCFGECHGVPVAPALQPWRRALPRPMALPTARRCPWSTTIRWAGEVVAVCGVAIHRRGWTLPGQRPVPACVGDGVDSVTGAALTASSTPPRRRATRCVPALPKWCSTATCVASPPSSSAAAAMRWCR